MIRNNSSSSKRDNIIREYIFYSIIYLFGYELLQKTVGIPSYFVYIADLFYLFFLTRGIFNRKKIHFANIIIAYRLLLYMLIIIVCGWILNMVSVPNIITGLRGQYLCLSVFFASVMVLTVSDYHKIMRFFFYYQFVNVFLALYQYFVMGYYQDRNNGAFTGGMTQDIFCGALFLYYYNQYTLKHCKMWKIIFVVASCLFIAVVEEEKFIFLEIALIIGYKALLSKKNFKNLFVLIVCIATIPYAIIKMGEINGAYSSEAMQSTSGMYDNLTTPGAGFGLPRIGSSAVIQKMFFDDPMKTLFGLGVGACEKTEWGLADTSFLQQYGRLAYYNFSFQIILLQTGWLGMLLYLSFFTALLFSNIRQRRKAPKQLKYLYDMAILITIILFISIWYNQTLRWYFAILPFFLLALGPVITRQINEKNSSDIM